MQGLWLCQSQREQLEQRGRRARVLLAEWAQRFEQWSRRAAPMRLLTPEREVVCSCVKSFLKSRRPYCRTMGDLNLTRRRRHPALWHDAQRL